MPEREDKSGDKRKLNTNPGLGPGAAPAPDPAREARDTLRMATGDALQDAFGRSARAALVEHPTSEGLDAAGYYAAPREVPVAHTGERDRRLVEIAATPAPPAQEPLAPVQEPIAPEPSAPTPGPEPEQSERSVTTAPVLRGRSTPWVWIAAGALAAAAFTVLLWWLHGRDEWPSAGLPSAVVPSVTVPSVTRSSPTATLTRSSVPVPSSIVASPEPFPAPTGAPAPPLFPSPTGVPSPIVPSTVLPPTAVVASSTAVTSATARVPTNPPPAPSAAIAPAHSSPLFTGHE